MEQQATGLTLFNRQITSERTQNYLTSVLGAKKDSFVSNLTALVANNKALQECEPMGVMFAAIKATALDLPLDPNLGFAYVIPYKNNREERTDAQFQIGAKGFIQLAIRSGQFKTLNVSEVKEGEIVDENLITGEITFKKAENRDALRTIGYVGYFKLTNGFEKMLYMSCEKLEAHASRYSQTYGSKKDYIRAGSKWTTDFDAMARKTVLKQLLSKFAPMSVEMQDAAKFDQGVLGENNSVRYIDNEETAAIPESVDKATLTSREAISEAFIGGQITEQEADDLMQKIGITKNAVEDATVEAEVNLFDTKSAKR